MKVDNKDKIYATLFGELNLGDVFMLLSDFCKEEKRVFMKCDSSNCTKGVNLETGLCYSFSDNEAVALLDGSFNIEGVQ